VRPRRRAAGASFVVTGGAGFIGSHLVDTLLAAEAARVVVLDDLSLGREENLADASADPRLEFHAVDCSDAAALARALGEQAFAACFNLAVVPLPASLVDPKGTVDRNVAITTSVCEETRAGRFGTLVQFSSSEIYGTACAAAISEVHPHRPETPYAASKLACDHVVASYRRTFGIDVLVVRPFNNYGPRQNAGTYAGLVPRLLGCLAAGEPIVIDGDGHQTRDFVYVTDTVAGTLALYELGEADAEPVNIGSGIETSVLDMTAAVLAAAARPDWPVVHGPRRPGDVRRHRAAVDRAREQVGFEPRTSLSEGVRRTVAWYVARSTRTAHAT
jgi:UDP-glucose 4-epimerase